MFSLVSRKFLAMRNIVLYSVCNTYSVYHFGQNPVSACLNPYVNIQSLKLQRLSGLKSQVLAQQKLAAIITEIFPRRLALCVCRYHVMLPPINLKNKKRVGNEWYSRLSCLMKFTYRIVASRSTSRLVTCLGQKHQQAGLVCMFNKAH